jgi:hypothetical protein
MAWFLSEKRSRPERNKFLRSRRSGARWLFNTGATRSDLKRKYKYRDIELTGIPRNKRSAGRKRKFSSSFI